MIKLVKTDCINCREKFCRSAGRGYWKQNTGQIPCRCFRLKLVVLFKPEAAVTKEICSVSGFISPAN